MTCEVHVSRHVTDTSLGHVAVTYCRSCSNSLRADPSDRLRGGGGGGSATRDCCVPRITKSRSVEDVNIAASPHLNNAQCTKYDRSQQSFTHNSSSHSSPISDCCCDEVGRRSLLNGARTLSGGTSVISTTQRDKDCYVPLRVEGWPDWWGYSPPPATATVSSSHAATATCSKKCTMWKVLAKSDSWAASKWRQVFTTLFFAVLLSTGLASPLTYQMTDRAATRSTTQRDTSFGSELMSPSGFSSTVLDTRGTGGCAASSLMACKDPSGSSTNTQKGQLPSAVDGSSSSLAQDLDSGSSNDLGRVYSNEVERSGTNSQDHGFDNIGDGGYRIARRISSRMSAYENKSVNSVVDKAEGGIHDDYDDALLLPPTPDEVERIQRFDPSKLNYTVIREALDAELGALNRRRRQGRFFSSPDSSTFRLPRFLSNLGKMLDIETVINELETSIMTSVSCNACKGGVGLLQHYIEQGNSREDIVRAASKLCTNFRVETPRVCFGIIHLMADEVVYIMTNLVMEPEGICGFLIGDVCGIPQDPYHKWRVLFPPYPKPPVQLVKPPKEDMPVYKVLHLSDTHFDPYYLEGSNADCNEPMCCRRTSGNPASAAARAGKWGDYRKCDTPERTIRSMFENIVRMHPDLDYILWTGDLPPHDIWNQTRDSNVLVLRQTVQQLFDHFPNTPVFPALGNHESAPVNSFPPPSIPPQHSVQWLYDELERQWRRWLPASTSATILKGGYYAVQVTPDFRIISLNMNYCNNKNWWLLMDSEDPADQLQWLVYELQSSELRGEKVHIIGHIPPGYHDCLRVWSHNFYKIVNRFEQVITAQFYGHTHFDEFELFYDTHRRHRVTNVAFVAPSQTSYYQLNPGYRVYRIQRDFEGSEQVGTDTGGRYESTITAQFYGHTHYDEFEVFYNENEDFNLDQNATVGRNGTRVSAEVSQADHERNTALKRRPSSVAYVAPSVTTYVGMNPGYRVYYVEGRQGPLHRVVDHETWVMDLDEANHPNNVHLEPRWYPLYSARQAYGMRSLLPVDWDNLVYRMVEDQGLFDTFYRHYWKNSPKRDACDSECKKRILCDLRSGRSNDREKTCATVTKRVDAHERSQWRSWVFSGFTVTSLATLFMWG